MAGRKVAQKKSRCFDIFVGEHVAIIFNKVSSSDIGTVKGVLMDHCDENYYLGSGKEIFAAVRKEDVGIMLLDDMETEEKPPLGTIQQ